MRGLKRLLLPLGCILMTTGLNSGQIQAPSWILCHAKSPRHPSAGTERPKERTGPRITGNWPSPISQSPSSYIFPSSHPALFLGAFFFCKSCPPLPHSHRALPPSPRSSSVPSIPLSLGSLQTKRLSVWGKKSCIMQMGKSEQEISHSENPHSGPAPRFPWHGQSLLEAGLHTDERGDEISTKAHR